MRKPITKSVIRELADRLRIESIEACMKSYAEEKVSHTTSAACLSERAAVKRSISDELYSILDGEA